MLVNKYANKIYEIYRYNRKKFSNKLILEEYKGFFKFPLKVRLPLHRQRLGRSLIVYSIKKMDKQGNLKGTFVKSYFPAIKLKEILFFYDTFPVLYCIAGRRRSIETKTVK